MYEGELSVEKPIFKTEDVEFITTPVSNFAEKLDFKIGFVDKIYNSGVYKGFIDIWNQTFPNRL